MKPEEHAQEAPQSNLERLRSHLNEGSLAEKLVSARIGEEGSDPHLALRKVVTDRIEELRRGYDLPDHNA